MQFLFALAATKVLLPLASFGYHVRDSLQLMPVLPRRSSWNDTLALKGRVQAAMLCNLMLGCISEDGLLVAVVCGRVVCSVAQLCLDAHLKSGVTRAFLLTCSTAMT